MTGLIVLIAVITLSLVPTPNLTAYYIKRLLLTFCLLFAISKLDWVGAFYYVDNLLEQYHLFLLEKTGNEMTARFAGFVGMFFLMQPIIIGGFFIFRKVKNH